MTHTAMGARVSPPSLSANATGSIPNTMAAVVTRMGRRRSLPALINTQAQIAKQAGIPRATWTNLESGAANPTLAVLIKAANALQVRLEELLTRRHGQGRVTRVSELPARKRGEVTVRTLLPETLAGLSLERMVFPQGGRMTGAPHTEGTREYLTCEHGAIKPLASGHVIVPRRWRTGVACYGRLCTDPTPRGRAGPATCCPRGTSSMRIAPQAWICGVGKMAHEVRAILETRANVERRRLH